GVPGGAIAGHIWNKARSFVPIHIPCVPVRVDGGRTWWVYYADGAVVSNTVRTCRTGDDILGAVVYGHGDCDWRDQHNQPVCYRNAMEAQRMLQAHGGIIDVQAQ